MNPTTLKRITRITAKIVIRVVAGIFLVIATLLLAIAFGDRSMPELHPWHEEVPAGEFRARDLEPGFTLDDYLAIEDQLFAGLDDFMLDPGDLRGNSEVGRYIRGGPGDPAPFERNWNRTFEFTVDEQKDDSTKRRADSEERQVVPEHLHHRIRATYRPAIFWWLEFPGK